MTPPLGDDRPNLTAQPWSARLMATVVPRELLKVAGEAGS